MSYIGDFEETAALHAISQKYDYVICGHIHQAQKRIITRDGRTVMYLNSGDWVENLTALEYHKGEWTVYQYIEESSVIPPATKEKRKNQTEGAFDFTLNTI